MEEDGPQIIRPVPRRPFDLSFINPTPPDDDASGTIPHHELLASRLLRLVDEPPSDISSPPSYMNLTSSTLAGIYSPGPSDGGDDDEDTAPYFKEEDEVVITPIEPRARTPLDSPDSEDEGLHMRRHTHTIRRDSIYSNNSVETNSGVSPTVSLILRAGVLFTLGTGFGVIITRYHTEGRFTSLADVATAASLDWKYWVFWGVAAVLLGTSLPLFDRYWEETHPPQTHAKPVLKPVEDEPTSESLDAGMDWALVVRAIGAFVGIAFAVRRLAWDSTLQVSATMTLVNPLLWWLIDRSKPGFMLSAIVSISGSALLMGVNPEMVPTPPSLASSSQNNSSGYTASQPLKPQDGYTGTSTVEAMGTGVWILSVLFCSCLCFGNIGRRLTQGQSALSKGRWGGLQ
ncbi:hypothetical protein S40285_09469 [Stachybotrys chlorohalonatus IBT 40285]|uniref:Uncharacterized protein n=1 Tax=Stachybotrys chlorohalonatus (strain IBT 40285) TaxID=1283841 RepID=A0A084QEF8_STAC4|nr:hypothetical protein S40285_09469 [Stachybotrys chlorohalonata IBT 40285]